MSEELAKYEYNVGYPKKYSTEYKWTLTSWSQLHDLTCDEDFTSPKFSLNGTNSYTCRIRLSPNSVEDFLITRFSNTQGIEAMKVHIHNGISSWTYVERNPIPKITTHSNNMPKDGSIRKHLLMVDENDAVVIVVKITIVKVSDYISVLKPPAKLPQMLNTSRLRQDVLANFKTNFDRKALCDVTLVLQDEIINAHKAVLAAQSTVFEAMFVSGMKEQNDNTIEVSNFDAEIFKQFLDYLYGEEVIKLEEKVEEMIVIADFYNVSDLKIKCESIMLESLSTNSAVRYVILADRINCDTLKTAALHVIRNSTTIIEKALLEEDIATVTELKEILSKNQRET